MSLGGGVACGTRRGRSGGDATGGCRLGEVDPRYVRANGIELAYEAFGSQDGEAIVLIAGVGAQMVTWQPAFCAALAGRGFYVVRYDSRDVGLSQRLPGSAYTVGDMADDAAGLIAKLGISPTHVVGQSLGGMVAQELVVRHPQRVRSLALFSSTPELSHFTGLAASVGGPRRRLSARSSYRVIRKTRRCSRHRTTRPTRSGPARWAASSTTGAGTRRGKTATSTRC